MWTSRPRSIRACLLSDVDRRELFSLLAQAAKRRFFAAWRAEDAALPVVLGDAFVVPLREPQAGDWPPVLPAGQTCSDRSAGREPHRPARSGGRIPCHGVAAVAHGADPGDRRRHPQRAGNLGARGGARSRWAIRRAARCRSISTRWHGSSTIRIRPLRRRPPSRSASSAVHAGGRLQPADGDSRKRSPIPIRWRRRAEWLTVYAILTTSDIRSAAIPSG